MNLENKQKIRVGLLQPGVFIQLDGKWFNHPFIFNKFKLKNLNQIEIIKKSGIKEVLWIPEKSDCWPIEEDESWKPEPQMVAVEKDDPSVELMWRIKKEQMEHLRQIHENMRRCTRNYDRISKNVPDLMKKMMTSSKEAIAGAKETVQGMVDTFLGDSDAVVHLINIKEKDEGIYHHSLNVAVLAIMLGKKAKLTASEMHELGMAALFHDIGKNQIEKKVLKKKGPLTKAESAIIKLHPQYGIDILAKSGVRDVGVLHAVKEHHEHYNGTGYPSGLRGEKISKLARIITIVDAYDNLCNNLDIEKRMTPYEALSHMYTKQQHQIDVDLFSVFIRSMGIYPPGTVVQLSNGETGIIITINPDNPLKPSLLLYDPNIPREEALICEMDKHDDIAIEKSIRIDELSDQVRFYLSATNHVTYFAEKGMSRDK
ncbi:MAG: HD-GYP domain-containing protein [Syntrophales bacterium]|nr:HD-GYP domain-containing protein [Syntrophales bacterium]